ncbi:hypothetical protein ACFU6S_21410 [Streptomyces sp. NPDC057456]|uniref:hypothetical protein n=1 Tax=Streptomyces sp. NPDC057456 TaxID=3346139 RepID=UPI003692F23F
MDVGRFVAKNRQHAVWQGLMEEQRELLQQIGIAALPAERETPAEGPGAASGAFEKGVAALAQYKARTGSVGPISRSHTEVIVIGGHEHAVKLGIFLSNTKSRAKLTPTSSMGAQGIRK